MIFVPVQGEHLAMFACLFWLKIILWYFSFSFLFVLFHSMLLVTILPRYLQGLLEFVSLGILPNPISVGHISLHYTMWHSELCRHLLARELVLTTFQFLDPRKFRCFSWFLLPRTAKGQEHCLLYELFLEKAQRRNPLDTRKVKTQSVLSSLLVQKSLWIAWCKWLLSLFVRGDVGNVGGWEWGPYSSRKDAE